MFKYLFIFLMLLGFSGVAGAVPSNCAQGATSGVLICAVSESNIVMSYVAYGLITIASTMLGVYVILEAMKK